MTTGDQEEAVKSRSKTFAQRGPGLCARPSREAMWTPPCVWSPGLHSNPLMRQDPQDALGSLSSLTPLGHLPPPTPHGCLRPPSLPSLTDKKTGLTPKLGIAANAWHALTLILQTTSLYREEICLKWRRESKVGRVLSTKPRGNQCSFTVTRSAAVHDCVRTSLPICAGTCAEYFPKGGFITHALVNPITFSVITCSSVRAGHTFGRFLRHLLLAHSRNAINIIFLYSFTHSINSYWTPVLFQALFWVLGNMLVNKSGKTLSSKGPDNLMWVPEQMNQSVNSWCVMRW